MGLLTPAPYITRETTSAHITNALRCPQVKRSSCLGGVMQMKGQLRQDSQAQEYLPCLKAWDREPITLVSTL